MNKPGKVCSFYVSDWHLITMLLPHVDKMIREGTKIVTIFEEDVSNKMQVLLSKLHLKNERQIRRIYWGNTIKIEERIQEVLEMNDQNSQIEIIISGKNEYIEKVNQIIDEYILKHSINQPFKIVNCFAVENSNVAEILKKHDYVLNTAGEKKKQAFLKGI